MRLRRVTADLPLVILLAVTLTLGAGLLAFVARYSWAVDPFVACETWVSTAVARLSTVGVLLPSGVLAAAAVAAVLALTHQLVATRRMLGKVLGARIRLTPPIAALAEGVGLAGRIDLVADPHAFTFCHGLIRPRVCVTTGLAQLLAPAELAAVLRHERHHVRFHDPLKILVGRTLASGLFFLPLAGLLRNGFLAGKELCADADANTDPNDLSLARALVKLLGADRPVWPAGVLAIGALSPTEARLQQLIEPTRSLRTLPSPMDWIVSAALVAGLFGFSFGAAAARRAPTVESACAPALAFDPGLVAQGAPRR
ncbi:MAG: M56 family metallopeptidase [Ardenticatenales bacterium]|nr:M56 family metallopeptidase [Ardenticatenales bacterium]